jgi:hypothetical protein
MDSKVIRTIGIIGGIVGLFVAYRLVSSKIKMHIMAKGLSDGTGLPYKEAKKIIKTFYKQILKEKHAPDEIEKSVDLLFDSCIALMEKRKSGKAMLPPKSHKKTGL